MSPFSRFYQIIICFPCDNAPGVHIIREDDVTEELLERMEAELGNFPSWCTPDEYAVPDSDGEYDSPQAICNIDDISISINASGIEHEAYTIIKTFHYIVG